MNCRSRSSARRDRAAKLVADRLAGRRELGDARGPQPVEPGVVVVVEAVLAVLVVVEAVLCTGGDGRV